MSTRNQEKSVGKMPKLRFGGFEGVWEERKLGDVGNVVTGSTPSTLNRDFYGGDYLFVSPADIKDGRFVSDTVTKLTEKGFNQGWKIKRGSVMFVCIGSTIGKVAQAGRDCITNQQINSVISNDENCNDFLYLRLLKDSGRIKLLAGKQAVPILNKSEFSKVKINVPSLAEQKKIAGFLGAVDEWIGNLKRQKVGLVDYKRGVMQGIFSGGIGFRDGNGDCFCNWEERKLGEICVLKKGTQLNKQNLSDKMFFPVINGGMTLSGYTDNCNTKANTITISEGGNSCGFVNLLKVDFWSGGHCYSLQDLKCNFLFLFQILKFSEKNIMRLRVGSGLPNIQKKDLEKLKIKLLSLDEQERIADFLCSLDNLIQFKQDEIDKAEQWKRGLMQGLFV